jgi:hypothetical protein
MDKPSYVQKKCFKLPVMHSGVTQSGLFGAASEFSEFNDDKKINDDRKVFDATDNP